MSMHRHAATCAAALLATLLAGCGSSQDSPTAPSPPPAAGSAVYYTAIGASDAAGVGSSAPCIPFTACPGGMGYVPVIVRQLQDMGSTVTLSNLGIPAAVISPGFQALGRQYGRDVPINIIDQEVPFVPRNSTVVTIFAGGNDIHTVAEAIDRGAGGADPLAFTDQQIKAFGNDFATLLKGIRDRAPQARIVVANLPNFAGIPMHAGRSLEEKQLLQKISVGFSTQVINPLAGQGVAVVDLLCDGRFTSGSYFSSDGFHPNDAGYATMAAEMMRAITSSIPAPQASCGAMTIVPPR
jgi:lysophospholipase L1-like esterase